MAVRGCPIPTINESGVGAMHEVALMRVEVPDAKLVSRSAASETITTRSSEVTFRP